MSNNERKSITERGATTVESSFSKEASNSLESIANKGKKIAEENTENIKNITKSGLAAGSNYLKDASNSVENIANKGKKIAEENKENVKTVAKVGLGIGAGCLVALIIGVLVIIGAIVYFVLK